ncbi:MAG: DUF547 domain-containing protein [Gammaproteobacteria bacterium]
MTARFAWVMLALALCVPASPVRAAGTAEAGAAWAAVLQRFVDDRGRVAFERLREDRADLDRYVAWIAGVSPRSDPRAFAGRDQVLAYYINAYNALAMHGVLEAGLPEDFGSFLKRARFFKFRAVTIGGERTSLYDLENDVIRPLGEPRVHFALNCMVRACPRLPREPFDAVTLDARLDAAAREFFASDTHLRIDDARREIRVSEILKFYTEDFVAGGKVQDLPGYIDRYRSPPLPAHYRVRFIPYDWTLNRQP